MRMGVTLCLRSISCRGTCLGLEWLVFLRRRNCGRKILRYHKDVIYYGSMVVPLLQTACSKQERS